MNIRRLIIILSIFLIVFFIIRGTPMTVAHEALRLVGKGTFVPSSYELASDREPLNVTSMFLFHDKIFSRDLINSNEAEYIIKNGSFKTCDEKTFFDFSNIMFDKAKLIDKTKFETTLYSYLDYHKHYEHNEKISAENIKTAIRRHYTDFEDRGNYWTWTSDEKARTYLLRYNIENKYIASIIVIKIRHEGYRVCSFIIE